MNRENSHDDAPEIPDSLRRDLEKLYGSQVDVPASVDAAILARARASTSPAPKRRSAAPRRRWAYVAASTAAVAALALLLFPRPSDELLRGDLDANRRIDVVDAMLLARQIRDGSTIASHADANGDGRMDSQDVDLLLRSSVRLEGGE